jgi:peroxiredoxin
MWNLNRIWIVLAAVGLIAAWVGCEKQPAGEKSKVAKVQKGSDAKASDNAADGQREETDKPKTAKRKPWAKKPAAKSPTATPEEDKTQAKAPEPPPATMPEVILDAEDRDASLVKVGDAMPEAELSDLDGKPQSLRSLLGRKLTVVVFWSVEDGYGLGQLRDMGEEVEKPYGAKGIRVIGIDVRDSAEAAAAKRKDAGPTLTVMLDREGALFAKVASAKLPRTYLLDSSGKVLWFDIGYSPTTRRQLLTAIRAVLGEKG